MLAPVPLPLKLTISSLSSGNVSLAVEGNSGQAVAVEKAFELGDAASWDRFSTLNLDKTGRATFEMPPTEMAGFFRVRSDSLGR